MSAPEPTRACGGLRGLLDDAERHRDRLRAALVTLSRAVVGGDAMAARVLAAAVLDDLEEKKL